MNRTMSYLRVLFTAAWLLTPLAASEAAAPTLARPNIVFILVDDLGWADLACYGSGYYETPNIDRLAALGMRFTQAYAAGCVCSPTRASILTGKYPARVHITAAIPIRGQLRMPSPPPLVPPDYCQNLPLEEFTIAEALKEAGYATASIGKWHVCWDKAYFPQYQGFDLNVAGNGMGNPGNYFYPYKGRWRMTPKHPWVRWQTLKGGQPKEYLTDRLTDEALRWMKDCRAQRRPFFLYLSHYAVHTPLQAKADLIAKYKEKPATADQQNPTYAAMIHSVDESVGRVTRFLDEQGLADDTLVVFTSDNGGVAAISSQRPLRAGKATLYEGGLRVPLIVRGPGIAPGSMCSVPVISSDHYPTLLRFAGLPLRPKQHLDGQSLVPLLKQSGGLDRDALFWHFPDYAAINSPDSATPSSAVRAGDWKLIEFFEDDRAELYNLKKDVGETRDRSRDLPDRVRDLRERLAAWRTSVGAQMPMRRE